MKLKANLSGNEHEISLCLAEGAVDVAVDDRHYDLQFRELASGEYLFINGSKVYKCRVSGQAVPSRAVSRLRLCSAGGPTRSRWLIPNDCAAAKAPAPTMRVPQRSFRRCPAKSSECSLQAGDQVEAGAGIIVVEAMKMQNEMKAPKAGTVVSINADEGATVNAGDVLAVIE